MLGVCGGVSVCVCARARAHVCVWRGVSVGMCVEGCQCGRVRGGVSVRACAWRGVSVGVCVEGCQ